VGITRRKAYLQSIRGAYFAWAPIASSTEMQHAFEAARTLLVRRAPANGA
jgi:hypothetical protein